MRHSPPARALPLALALAAGPAGCSDGIAPGARIGERWYGELARHNISLELVAEGDEVTGRGWFGLNNSSGTPATDFSDPLPFTVSGHLRGSELELTTTILDGPPLVYRISGTAVAERLDVRFELVHPAPSPWAPEEGTLVRSDSVRGEAVVRTTVSGATAPIPNGESVQALTGQHLSDGRYVLSTGRLAFTFAGGRPAVGRYAINPPTPSAPAGVPVDVWMLEPCAAGGCATWRPDRAGAGEMEITTSTPRAVVGTFRFTAVRVEGGRIVSPPLTAEGSFSAACIEDACR